MTPEKMFSEYKYDKGSNCLYMLRSDVGDIYLYTFASSCKVLKLKFKLKCACNFSQMAYK